MVRFAKRSVNVSVVLFGLALVFASSTVPTSAQAACGEFYRIQRGDTLRELTLKSLGHDRYQVLYRANRDILPSPEKLETGQLIFVPCEDGIQTRGAALADSGVQPTPRDNLGDRAGGTTLSANVINVVTPSATKPSQESQAVPDGSPETPEPSERDRPLRLMTASGMAPLAEFSLPEGGLLPVLIQTALAAGGVSGEQEVSFVDDRKSHLSVLMPTGAFDLTFPWPGANCGKAGLGTAARALCRDFLISRPIYEARIVAIVPSNSPLVAATSPEALRGKRVCRPAGFPPVDLESMNLDIVISVKRTTADCVEMLTSEKVDAVSVPAGQSKPSEWDGMVAAEGLTWLVPVHALAWRKSDGAKQTIAALDEGLERLQRSGRWFNIVSSYLHDVNARVAGTGN